MSKGPSCHRNPTLKIALAHGYSLQLGILWSNSGANMFILHFFLALAPGILPGIFTDCNLQLLD